VLSDPRVSRRHAQLRWRFGRHVLYDLASSGGTTVNGRAITEAALDPGDVFSLGGADIIYGRDPQDQAPLSERDTPSGWAGSTRAFDSP
jgi:pSer/pThr/pTyr-binding forkhead associated (FHA) protein